MHELIKKNSKLASASIWCMAVTVCIGAILRIIEIAGGQFVPIASMKILPGLAWQIPLIPRAFDVILAGIIWTVLMVFAKNQKDEELARYTIAFFALGIVAVLIFDIDPDYATILNGFIEGVMAVLLIFLLSYTWKLITRGDEYPRADIYTSAVVGYLLGESLIYAFVFGVIYGTIAMIASIVVAVSLVSFFSGALKILRVKKISEEKPVDEQKKPA